MRTILCILSALSVSATAQIFSEQAARATYKLFNEGSTATCFVLEDEGGQQYVVTAAHVFEKMSGEKAVLVSRGAGGGCLWGIRAGTTSRSR